jgi:hypothetical protein
MTGEISAFALVKPPEEAHDGPMGEKPLSIDEVPTTAAAGINTTRSNIKKAGGVTAAEGGAATAGGESAPGIAIKEQGVKYGEGAGMATDGDPVPGLDVKLGRNPGGAIAGANNPIPGVDVIVKKDHR